MMAEANEVAVEAAKVAADAAKMDAIARRSRKEAPPADGVSAQLQKLKAENEALKKLALDMASNKEEVRCEDEQPLLFPPHQSKQYQQRPLLLFLFCNVCCILPLPLSVNGRDMPVICWAMQCITGYVSY
jgi:hypothetical protein